MSGYVKIYGSILGSSVWAESLSTRIVWITMLALADEHGHVEASVSGLARFANVTVPECRSALEQLSSPDEDSKSPEHDGRRVEKADRGWLILNYLKYREMRSPKQVAEAERKAAWRDRQRDERYASQPAADMSQMSPEIRATVDGAVSVAVKSSSSSSMVESELAERLPTDSDRVALTALIAIVGNRPAWLAELTAALEGMHGPPLSPAQLGEALRDFVANGLPANPTLAHFRAYMKRAASPSKAMPQRHGLTNRAFATAMDAIKDITE